MSDPHPAAGGVTFARYAFPPNELGYCGPEDPDVLLAYATSGAVPAAEIVRRAKQFDGAWAYLELIAAAAGIDDPLDHRVVEAYWLGNDLLGDGAGEQFLEDLRTRMPGQLTGPVDPATARPHHSFQVFTVYPWVGLLSVRADLALSVLESCRIRWGTVTGLDGDRAEVLSRPLTWDGHRLALGAERVELVRWARGGRALIAAPVVGETVACHWDWVCDRLTESQRIQLATRSAAQLDATNATNATSGVASAPLGKSAGSE